MHSHEVHSNDSACRKSVRLGLEQVFIGIQAKLNSGLLILDWLTNLDLFNLLPSIASFYHIKTRSYPGTIQQCCVLASDTASTHYMQNLNQICKNRTRTIL